MVRVNEIFNFDDIILIDVDIVNVEEEADVWLVEDLYHLADLDHNKKAGLQWNSVGKFL